MFDRAVQVDLPARNDYLSIYQWRFAVAAQEEQWSDRPIFDTGATGLFD